jgi:hypothetical protein
MRNVFMLFLTGITIACHGQINQSYIAKTSLDSLNLFSMIQPIEQQNIFSDSLYNIWCGSVIKGKNDKYYMFYSRWPKAYGHFAWLPASEIALAKADKPEGPYTHIKVVFEKRGADFWDGICTHNPAIIENKGKYYLYYMGTTGKSNVNMPASMQDNNWWEYRNNQRIGVAVATDLEGKWTRFGKPVLDISLDSTAFDALMISNPAVAVDENGKVILAYKQVAKKTGNIRGGKVRFGVAFSNSMLGPFEKYSEPIFQNKEKDNPSVWMMAEDPFLWSSNGKFYAIVTDVIGAFTNKQAALALLNSSDGINWTPTKYPKVVPHRLLFANGVISDDKLERPWLYFENGRPKVLFGALGVNKRSYSVNVAINLK